MFFWVQKRKQRRKNASVKKIDLLVFCRIHSCPSGRCIFVIIACRRGRRRKCFLGNRATVTRPSHRILKLKRGKVADRIYSVKGFCANICNSRAYYYTAKSYTLLEGTVAYCGYAIGNSHGSSAHRTRSSKPRCHSYRRNSRWRK